MAAEYVITLVHGTWGDTKGWVARGSFLRRELERQLGSVAFRRFSWSGANTHAARIAGGANLARFIRDGHAESPDARHVIIAHSHGGNVALYALRDPAAREVVSSIVTLATPFIHANPRALYRHIDVIAWMMLVVAILSVFAVLDAFSLERLALAWIMLAAFFTLKLKPLLTEWLLDSGRLEEADLVANVEPPPIERSRLLALRVRGDEATRWLRTWNIVQPFIVTALLFALFVFEGVSRSTLVEIADALSWSIGRRGLDVVNVFGYDGWALGLGLTVCLLGGILLMLSPLMNPPAYWGDPPRANLFMTLKTGSTPRALGSSHTAYTVDLPPTSTRRRSLDGLLRHSVIYEHPLVVSAVVNWIRHRARPAAGAARRESRLQSFRASAG